MACWTELTDADLQLCDKLIGNWIASTPIPNQSLETLESRLDGNDKMLFLALMRKILRWRPEDRPSALELLEDEFLCQCIPPP